MASSTANPVKILDLCLVTPSRTNSLPPFFSLPLTFFDMFLFRFPSAELIFFYQLPPADSAPTHFNSVILPELKHSLSLTLAHFLPLAGKLTWPAGAPKPFILYTKNDGVPLTVAESSADFAHLSRSNFRLVTESHPYIPALPVSDSAAAPLSLQITLFPDQGFSIGISSHHAILDGSTLVMFMKAWAHIIKKQPSLSLPPELTPSFDRTVVNDPEGLASEFLNHWLEKERNGRDKEPGSIRSLKPLPMRSVPPSLVRAEFELSRKDINKLRESVISYLGDKGSNPKEPPHLSSFVLTFSYAAVCMLRAKGIDLEKEVSFVFAADCKARLDPPIPSSYFGNCVMLCKTGMKMRDLKEADENGVALVAERVSELVRGIGKREGGVQREMKEVHKKFMDAPPDEMVTVFGSPRFAAYMVDFGWGKPEKVEVSSIDGTGAVSMAESRDGSGGVEIGLVLKRHEMQLFESFFVNGLK